MKANVFIGPVTFIFNDVINVGINESDAQVWVPRNDSNVNDAFKWARMSSIKDVNIYDNEILFVFPRTAIVQVKA